MILEEVRWVDEPTGLQCMARHLGYGGVSGYWWCGYVRVPVGHRLHGVLYSAECEEPADWKTRRISDYDESYPVIPMFARRMALDVAICVHGGLTFSESLKDDDGWWFGFDCNHADDQDRDLGLDYVREHCRRLAAQLHDWPNAQITDWQPTPSQPSNTARAAGGEP